MSARADEIGQECRWKGAGRIRTGGIGRVFLGIGEIGHGCLWDWAGVLLGAGGIAQETQQEQAELVKSVHGSGQD